MFLSVWEFLLRIGYDDFEFMIVFILIKCEDLRLRCFKNCYYSDNEIGFILDSKEFVYYKCGGLIELFGKVVIFLDDDL